MNNWIVYSKNPAFKVFSTRVAAKSLMLTQNGDLVFKDSNDVVAHAFASGTWFDCRAFDATEGSCPQC